MVFPFYIYCSYGPDAFFLRVDVLQVEAAFPVEPSELNKGLLANGSLRFPFLKLLPCCARGWWSLRFQQVLGELR